MADATPGSAPSSNRNVMIVLSYLWLLALVPLLTEKDDKEVQWHAKHGLVLMVAELFLWIVISIVLGAARHLRLHRRAVHAAAGARPADPAHHVHREGHQRPAADHPRPSATLPISSNDLPAATMSRPLQRDRDEEARFRRRRDRLIAIALDLRRPPSAQWSTAAAVGGIHLYQATLSPLYAKLGVRCRFTPTCSHYGEKP